MIVVTVFLLIMNQPKFHLVHNQKENYHYDHIPLNLIENENLLQWDYISDGSNNRNSNRNRG